MVSIFPDMLAFSMLGTTLVRVAVGYIFLLLAVQFARVFFKKNSAYRTLTGALTVLYTVSGILLILGLYTQIIAILGATLAFFGHITSPRSKTGLGQNHLFFLLWMCCLSLLFLGPGAFAIDLPL